MPKDKAVDEVKLAKEMAKFYKIDTAKIAQIMMKNGLDAKGMKKTVDECEQLNRQQVVKMLKSTGLF